MFFETSRVTRVYPILILRVCDIVIRERVAGCGRICAESEGAAGEEESGF